jgi:prepilin-type N-terminal cleavage/methylation domain-containing protein
MQTDPLKKAHGFSLIEMMMALMLLTVSLLTAGQLIYATASSCSLARAKMTAAIAARDKIERLSSLFAHNPFATEFSIGDHGPQQIEIVNPLTGTALDTYNIFWTISEIPDPRPGKKINALVARITIVPHTRQIRFNKILNVTAVFSPKALG